MNYNKISNKINPIKKTNHSIGIGIGIRNKENKIKSGIFDPIILKGSKIPCSKTKKYYTLYDNQTSTVIRFYQGNCKYVKDNLFLGNLIIKDIPKSLAGEEKIKLSLHCNSYEILDIRAEILGEKKVYKKTINMLEQDQDIISFEKNINYDNWEEYRLAYMVRAAVRYGEEKLEDLNSFDAKQINRVLREIKKYLLLDNEKMVKKYKNKLVYLLSEVS